MRKLLAFALTVIALMGPVQADQILGPGQIDSSNRVVLPGGPTLGRWQNNRYIATPDSLQLQGAGSTGDVSGMSAQGLGPATRLLSDRFKDLPTSLAEYHGFDPTGATSSSAAMTAWLNATAVTGGTLLIRKTDKVLLTQDIVVNQGQRILGEFDLRVHSAAGGAAAFDQIGGIRLGNGAKIRLDNGGQLARLLIYRQGLTFAAQDLSTWTGTGVQLGYGSDQTLRDVMVLGFNQCVGPLFDRGLSGASRVIIDGLYLDGVNGLKLVGSFDTSFVDRVRAFPFVTQNYPGAPAAGEGYDPRKDRRPGIGVQWLDRADGTKFGRVEVFGYATGFDTNVSGWQATTLTADYPQTATNPSPTGTVGLRLRSDTDNSTGTPRPVDTDPSVISTFIAFSMERGIVSSGTAGRTASIGVAKVLLTTGDAVTITGGGLQISDLETRAISGTPVVFGSAPNTVSRIRGVAAQFGANRDSATFGGSPVVKAPAGSAARFIDVKLASDHPAGAIYFDHIPRAATIASTDPLVIPDAQGQDLVEVRVTGTVTSGSMSGPAGVDVDLYAVSGFTLFASSNPDGFNLLANLAIPAKGRVRLRRSGDSGGWEVVSRNF